MALAHHSLLVLVPILSSRYKYYDCSDKNVDSKSSVERVTHLYNDANFWYVDVVTSTFHSSG